MIDYAEIVGCDNTVMFEHQTLFDRKYYKNFIEDFPHDITGRSFTWLVIAGLKHVYRITNHNELIHVLAYVYNALIRDPLATIVKVPVMPPIVINLQPLQPPNGVVVLDP